MHKNTCFDCTFYHIKFVTRTHLQLIPFFFVLNIPVGRFAAQEKDVDKGHFSIRNDDISSLVQHVIHM